LEGTSFFLVCSKIPLISLEDKQTADERLCLLLLFLLEEFADDVKLTCSDEILFISELEFDVIDGVTISFDDIILVFSIKLF